MRPTWGPPGSCRPQMGPMLASWSLPSGPWYRHFHEPKGEEISFGRISKISVNSFVIHLSKRLTRIPFIFFIFFCMRGGVDWEVAFCVLNSVTHALISNLTIIDISAWMGITDQFYMEVLKLHGNDRIDLKSVVFAWLNISIRIFRWVLLSIRNQHPISIRRSSFLIYVFPL